MITHVIDGLLSPVEAPVYVMWCGASALALDDGSLLPELDYIDEKDADKADCQACRRNLSLRWAAGRERLKDIMEALA